MTTSSVAAWHGVRLLFRAQCSIPVICKKPLSDSLFPCCSCSKVSSNRLSSLGVRTYSESVQVNHPDADELFKTIDLEVKSHDKALLNSYEQYICLAAKELSINVSKVWTPPRVIERYSLLKSVHIYKKHFVQYETRTNYRTIQLKHLTGSTANTLLEYIQRNLPEGVAMKVTKHKVEALPDYIKPPVQEAADLTEEKLQT